MRHLRALAALSLLLAGCVAAYDPSVPARNTLESRAEEVGTREPRPAPRRQWFSRWRQPRLDETIARETGTAPAAAATTPTQPATSAAAPPAAAATTAAATSPPNVPLGTAPQPTLAEPAADLPDSPAGRQLAWWIAVLRGGDQRGLESHFSPEFLKAVPAGQVRQIARQWRADEFGNGPVEFVRFEEEPAPNRVVALVRGMDTDRYTRIRLGTDQAGRIAGLWLGPVVGLKRGEFGTWAALDEGLSRLAGQVSLAAYQLTPESQLREIYALNHDTSLALGSTMKLYILGALAEEIAAGAIKWDEPLAIREDLKSLPSGRMQLDREGAEFPISQFVEQMISISDNTAADHLLARVGRDKVEAYLARFNSQPERTRPFLSSMEFFRIKLSADRTLADRYAAADEATRRAMIAPGGEVTTAVPTPLMTTLWRIPYHIRDIEWFASAPDLGRVMADLHRLERVQGMEPLARALRINPGLQMDGRVWKSIAYKGGSEPGVLNMTWLLTRDDGAVFTLAFTWNDPEKDVDLKRATELAGAAVALLVDEGRSGR
jgi:hypothetical protein